MNTNYDYVKDLKLKHHEIPAKIDKRTGQVTEILDVERSGSNIPKGKSLLKYDRFNIVNSTLFVKLTKYFTMEELGVISYMASIAEFNTNSLKPLSDETSLRELEEIFNISKNRIGKITDKLFKFGVFLQIKVHVESVKEYWVLNPYISWKGRLKNDSIFEHFIGTDITKLIS